MILDTNALSAIADGESGAARRFASAAKDAGTPIPSNDAWIAALCRQHTLPILSRDRHFDLIEGLKRFDW